MDCVVGGVRVDDGRFGPGWDGCTLARTSDDILALGPDIHTGWGRVNMLSGVTLGMVPPEPAPTGAPSPNAEQVAYLTENSCTPGFDLL